MKANKNNFYMTTKATFAPIEKPTTKPDYISASGSRYWYTGEGVIRSSDHWGIEIASCDWFLENGECGYCSFENFEHKELSVAIYSKTKFEGYENDIDDMGNYYISINTSFENCYDGMFHFEGHAIGLNSTHVNVMFL